jgi:hypothetical protein
MKRSPFASLLLLAALSLPAAAGGPPPNSVVAEATASVAYDPNTGLHTYSYTFANVAGSPADIDLILVPLNGASVTNVSAPPGWRGGIWRDQLHVYWYASEVGAVPPEFADADIPPSVAQIHPGQALSGFSFQSADAPDTGSFHARGYTPYLPVAGVDVEEITQPDVNPPPMTDAAETFQGTTQTPKRSAIAVAVTAPAYGAHVTGTNTLTAIASATDGIASVQFKLDGADLGPPLTALPYSYTWDSREAENAAHLLTATARTPADAQATSNAVGITVFNDKTPPWIAITRPTNGEMVSGFIVFELEGGDDVAITSLELLVDGVVIPQAWGAVQWDTLTASEGNHTLVVKAYDAVGNVGASAPVSVLVNNDPPAPFPVDLEAGNSSVLMTWGPVEGAVSYNIRRGQTSDEGPFSPLASVTTASYRDTGLNNGTRYFYAVSAVTAEEEGAYTWAIGAVPTATPINEQFSSSSSANRFSVLSGTWAVSGGAYRLTASEPTVVAGLSNRTFHIVPVAASYTLGVTATATATAGTSDNVAVMFGVQDESNYYFASFSETNTAATSGIFKVAGGAVTQLADITSTIAGGTAYAIKVERHDGLIRVYRAGTLQATAYDTTFGSGAVGLGTLDSLATFDAFVVTLPKLAESFDDGAASFTADAGGWSVVSGAYKISTPVTTAPAGLGNRSLDTTLLLGDFTLTTEASAVATAGTSDDLAVIVGWQDGQNYVYVSFSERNDAAQSGIFRVSGGTVTQLADITSLVAGGTTYTITVQRTGTQLRASLNGSLKATATIATMPGRAGFGSKDGQATFDNLFAY